MKLGSGAKNDALMANLGYLIKPYKGRVSLIAGSFYLSSDISNARYFAKSVCKTDVMNQRKIISRRTKENDK